MKITWRMVPIVLTCAILGASAATAAGAPPPSEGIAVVGTGTAKAPPDRVDVEFGASAEDTTVEKAKATVDNAVGKTLRFCAELGIPESSITASELLVGPLHYYDPHGEVLAGYRASRDVEVRLDRLDQFSALIQGAIGAGITEVKGVTLSTSRRSELRLQALAQAVQAARREAELLARETGRGLGSVVSVATEAARPRERYTVKATSSDGLPEFKPGFVEVTAEVSVVFAMK